MKAVFAPCGAQCGRDARGPSEELELERVDEGRGKNLFAPYGAQCGRDARGPSEELELERVDEG
jgi:hypothetical protein